MPPGVSPGGLGAFSATVTEALQLRTTGVMGKLYHIRPIAANRGDKGARRGLRASRNRSRSSAVGDTALISLEECALVV